MTYVIAEPCIGTKDLSCVEVCPVDCIHPTQDEPGFDDQAQLYIDPEECIDCDACVERVRSMRASPRISCPTSGRSTSRSTPSTTSADIPSLAATNRIVNVYHRQLGHRAGDLIATSAVIGLFAIGVRASWGGAPARALEGATLSLAAAAYVAHALARHETTRELLTRSILVSAFALWGLVQIAPGLPGNATLNDVVIVLFVVDLAILVSPLALSARP